jgi:hypothetical protein
VLLFETFTIRFTIGLALDFLEQRKVGEVGADGLDGHGTEFGTFRVGFLLHRFALIIMWGIVL